ncbi:MAG: copper-binding protein [Rhodospirillales bacterium]|nr:copper-binding protein [Rhodospirillales bacterium]
MSLAAFGLGLLLPTAQPQAADPAETKAICDKAAARYKKLDIDKPKDGAVVLMYKYTFCPAQKSVKAGTAVHFINVDKRTSHSVWFKEAGQKESDRFFPEEGFMVKFDQPGTYPYLCGPHWKEEGMKGALTVTP